MMPRTPAQQQYRLAVREGRRAGVSALFRRSLAAL